MHRYIHDISPAAVEKKKLNTSLSYHNSSQRPKISEQQQAFRKKAIKLLESTKQKTYESYQVSLADQVTVNELIKKLAKRITFSHETYNQSPNMSPLLIDHFKKEKKCIKNLSSEQQNIIDNIRLNAIKAARRLDYCTANVKFQPISPKPPIEIIRNKQQKNALSIIQQLMKLYEDKQHFTQKQSEIQRYRNLPYNKNYGKKIRSIIVSETEKILNMQIQQDLSEHINITKDLLQTHSDILSLFRIDTQFISTAFSIESIIHEIEKKTQSSYFTSGQKQLEETRYQLHDQQTICYFRKKITAATYMLSIDPPLFSRLHFLVREYSPLLKQQDLRSAGINLPTHELNNALEYLHLRDIHSCEELIFSTLNHQINQENPINKLYKQVAIQILNNALKVSQRHDFLDHLRSQKIISIENLLTTPKQTLATMMKDAQPSTSDSNALLTAQHILDNAHNYYQDMLLRRSNSSKLQARNLPLKALIRLGLTTHEMEKKRLLEKLNKEGEIHFTSKKQIQRFFQSIVPALSARIDIPVQKRLTAVISILEKLKIKLEAITDKRYLDVKNQFASAVDAFKSDWTSKNQQTPPLDNSLNMLLNWLKKAKNPHTLCNQLERNKFAFLRGYPTDYLIREESNHCKHYIRPTHSPSSPSCSNSSPLTLLTGNPYT